MYGAVAPATHTKRDRPPPPLLLTLSLSGLSLCQSAHERAEGYLRELGCGRGEIEETTEDRLLLVGLRKLDTRNGSRETRHSPSSNGTGKIGPMS